MPLILENMNFQINQGKQSDAGSDLEQKDSFFEVFDEVVTALFCSANQASQKQDLKCGILSENSPSPPFTKGGTIPLFEKEVPGEIFMSLCGQPLMNALPENSSDSSIVNNPSSALLVNNAHSVPLINNPPLPPFSKGGQEGLLGETHMSLWLTNDDENTVGQGFSLADATQTALFDEKTYMDSTERLAAVVTDNSSSRIKGQNADIKRDLFENIESLSPEENLKDIEIDLIARTKNRESNNQQGADDLLSRTIVSEGQAMEGGQRVESKENFTGIKADMPLSPDYTVSHEKAATLQGSRAMPEPINIGEHKFTVIRNDSKSIELSLEPDGMGMLEIEIISEKGMINARISAADEAAKGLIERNLQNILDALIKEGLNVGGFSVFLKDKREDMKPEGAKGDVIVDNKGEGIIKNARGRSSMVSIFI